MKIGLGVLKLGLSTFWLRAMNVIERKKILWEDFKNIEGPFIDSFSSRTGNA